MAVQLVASTPPVWQPPISAAARPATYWDWDRNSSYEALCSQEIRTLGGLTGRRAYSTVASSPSPVSEEPVFLGPGLRVQTRRVHRWRVDAIGFLFGAVVYFGLTAGSVVAAVWHIDEKTAVPWASPWRMRSAKLCAVGGPVLFVLAFVVAVTGLPVGVFAVPMIGSLAVPWLGAVLITVEWLRRRAEDRATGIARPRRPGV